MYFAFRARSSTSSFRHSCIPVSSAGKIINIFRFLVHGSYKICVALSRLDPQNSLRNHQNIFGNPTRITTDNSTDFTVKEFLYLLRMKSIEHVLIPRNDGQVQRLNRTIISILTELSTEDPEKWFKHLSRVQKLLNSTAQEKRKSKSFRNITGSANEEQRRPWRTC